ncbi:hypothetical protein ACN27G_34840 [Plantactinospora sp. WMMB334]|uniref:hypothetical protein n=1 Tax=Plantactinospora sp. WMMB334 TaxID=3404119 RepID=UPI003B942269
MNPIDKRIGELMVRLRLSRRAAELRACLEIPTPPTQTDRSNRPDTDERRSDYGLAA